MGKIRVKVNKTDEELLYRQTTITHLDKRIEGPTRAIRVGAGADSGNTIAEAYSTFDDVRVQRATNEPDFSSGVENTMRRKFVEGALNLHFVNYNQLTPLTEKEINTLTSLQYVYSDVAITPCWTGLVSKGLDFDRIEKLNEWNSMAIEAIERLNHKSIMGIVPMRIHHNMLDSVIGNFIDNDVTHFAIDHGNRSFKSRGVWLREFQIQLHDHDITDSALIYSLNAPGGRMSQKKLKVLANDFTSSAYGIDVLGFSHNRGWSADIRPESDGSQPLPPPERTYRLFDSDTYAYVKVPESQTVKLFNVPTSRCNEVVRHQNVNAQLEEYKEIVKVLKEHPTALGYVGTKEAVTSDFIKAVKKVRTGQDSRQVKLFN